jgi:hypothetical protein
MSSAEPSTPSSAITSQMSSRSRGSPCPDPYCSATAPFSRITFAVNSAISSSGRAAM